MTMGTPKPEEFQGDGPYEISLETIEKLSKSFDLGFIHSIENRGRKSEKDNGVGLWLDDKGFHFGQR